MTYLTDIIILILTLFFFRRGWKKGIIRTMLGPAAIVISSVAAILHFSKTQDLLISILIGVLGPFAIGIIFLLIRVLWKKIFNRDDDGRLFWLSRFLGGCFNLAWNGSIAILFLLLIISIPFNIPKLHSVQKNIKNSMFWNFCLKMPNPQGGYQDIIKNYLNLLNDPSKLEGVQEISEFQSLQEDEKIKEILSDKETIQQLQTRDISKLIANPKINNLINDEELMKKFMKLNSKILEGTIMENSAKPKHYKVNGKGEVIEVEIE